MISKDTPRSGITHERWATWKLPILGSVAWTLLALASWRLRGPVNFVDRDDGIITLAHARNFVEFGTVSVGRFGDRVDGFSAPLHFVTALPYFALGGGSYVLFNRIIAFVSIAAVGALTGTIVGTELRSARNTTKVVALLAAGLLQFASWSFFGWHFSGMENPLTTALLLGVVAAGPSAARSHRGALVAGVLLGFLSIARLDAVSLAVPLLLVLLYRVRSLRGRDLYVRALLLVLPPALIGGSTVLALTAYFGTPFSTTVENRSRGTTQLLGVSLSAVMITVSTLTLLRGLAMVADREDPEVRDHRRGLRLGLLGAAGIVYGTVTVATIVGDSALRSAAAAFYISGGLWAAVFIGIAWAVPRVRPERLLLFTAVLIWVPLYEMVFGPTRIDTGRVISSAVPVLSLATVVVSARLVVWATDSIDRSTSFSTNRMLRWSSVVAVLGVALIPVSLSAEMFGSARSTYARTFYLGWEIEPRPTVLLDTADRTVGQVDQRIVPIVAAADLGKLAYRGRSQIIDLGSIGDPLYLQIMKRVTDKAERARYMEMYLGKVLPPDTWMLNGVWACPVATLTSDTSFTERYMPIDVGSASSTEDGDIRSPVDCDGATPRVGVWTLKDPTSARDLQLASQLLDGTVAADADFLDACRSDHADRTDECFTRMRAYRRAFLGVDGSRRAEAMLVGLDATPAGRLVTSLIRSPEEPGWWHDAFAALKELDATSP